MSACTLAVPPWHNTKTRHIKMMDRNGRLCARLPGERGDESRRGEPRRRVSPLSRVFGRVLAAANNSIPPRDGNRIEESARFRLPTAASINNSSY